MTSFRIGDRLVGPDQPTYFIADIAAHRVIGKGPDGYREALQFLTRE